MPEARRPVFLCAVIAAAFALTPLARQVAAPAPDVAARYARTEHMVPMRDGVKLFTVLLTPKDAREPLPIVMERTPYSADGAGQPRGLSRNRDMADEGYIFAFQDIRGRYRSEGTFVMNRPSFSRKNPAPGIGDPGSGKPLVDEATDTWDTVDWLVKEGPRNNGRVGIMGVSYPGFLAAVPIINPHPALKTVSPQAPMIDTWMGDDFFHQGAFRQSYGYEYVYDLEASRDGSVPVQVGRPDAYDWYLSFLTLGALGKAANAMRLPTWRSFVEHPAYDAYWKAKAVQRQVRNVSVPTLTVGGWWDQEDIFGPQALYAALEPTDTAGANMLVMGPWYHGQWSSGAADRIGRVKFGSATGDTYRRDIQAPWFAYWLKDKGTGRFPDSRLFDTGADAWRTFDTWPPKEASPRKLYFHANGRLSFDAPTADAGADEYLSDPARPVPYRQRPIEATYGPGSRWREWQAEDQRFVHNRPDVLSWETEPLTADVQLAGTVVARLFASTTGSDADWVVKLIDVYPAEMPQQRDMAGFQLMVTGEVLRGRYRRSFEQAEAIAPNAVAQYTVSLNTQLHRFRAGHRIMVQVQSTWFPLYDRNPQTFVPNIFLADASAYRAQTHRIHRTASQPSHVEMLTLR